MIKTRYILPGLVHRGIVEKELYKTVRKLMQEAGSAKNRNKNGYLITNNLTIKDTHNLQNSNQYSNCTNNGQFPKENFLYSILLHRNSFTRKINTLTIDALKKTNKAKLRPSFCTRANKANKMKLHSKYTDRVKKRLTHFSFDVPTKFNFQQLHTENNNSECNLFLELFRNSYNDIHHYKHGTRPISPFDSNNAESGDNIRVSKSLPNTKADNQSLKQAKEEISKITKSMSLQNIDVIKSSNKSGELQSEHEIKNTPNKTQSVIPNISKSEPGFKMTQSHSDELSDAETSKRHQSSVKKFPIDSHAKSPSWQPQLNDKQVSEVNYNNNNINEINPNFKPINKSNKNFKTDSISNIRKQDKSKIESNTENDNSGKIQEIYRTPELRIERNTKDKLQYEGYYEDTFPNKIKKQTEETSKKLKENSHVFHANGMSRLSTVSSQKQLSNKNFRLDHTKQALKKEKSDNSYNSINKANLNQIPFLSKEPPKSAINIKFQYENDTKDNRKTFNVDKEPIYKNFYHGHTQNLQKEVHNSQEKKESDVNGVNYNHFRDTLKDGKFVNKKASDYSVLIKNRKHDIIAQFKICASDMLKRRKYKITFKQGPVLNPPDNKTNIKEHFLQQNKSGENLLSSCIGGKPFIGWDNLNKMSPVFMKPELLDKKSYLMKYLKEDLKTRSFVKVIKRANTSINSSSAQNNTGSDNTFHKFFPKKFKNELLPNNVCRKRVCNTKIEKNFKNPPTYAFNIYNSINSISPKLENMQPEIVKLKHKVDTEKPRIHFPTKTFHKMYNDDLTTKIPNYHQLYNKELGSFKTKEYSDSPWPGTDHSENHGINLHNYFERQGRNKFNSKILLNNRAKENKYFPKYFQKCVKTQVDKNKEFIKRESQLSIPKFECIPECPHDNMNGHIADNSHLVTLSNSIQPRVILTSRGIQSINNEDYTSKFPNKSGVNSVKNVVQFFSTRPLSRPQKDKIIVTNNILDSNNGHQSKDTATKLDIKLSKTVKNSIVIKSILNQNKNTFVSELKPKEIQATPVDHISFEAKSKNYTLPTILQQGNQISDKPLVDPVKMKHTNNKSDKIFIFKNNLNEYSKMSGVTGYNKNKLNVILKKNNRKENDRGHFSLSFTDLRKKIPPFKNGKLSLENNVQIRSNSYKSSASGSGWPISKKKHRAYRKSTLFKKILLNNGKFKAYANNAANKDNDYIHEFKLNEEILKQNSNNLNGKYNSTKLSKYKELDSIRLFSDLNNADDQHEGSSILKHDYLLPSFMFCIEPEINSDLGYPTTNCFSSYDKMDEINELDYSEVYKYIKADDYRFKKEFYKSAHLESPSRVKSSVLNIDKGKCPIIEPLFQLCQQKF